MKRSDWSRKLNVIHTLNCDLGRTCRIGESETGQNAGREIELKQLKKHIIGKHIH